MFVEGFNRTLDRAWAFLERQVGLVKGAPGPGKEVGFQPSLYTGAFVVAAILYQIVSGALLLLYYQPSVYPTLTLCGQASGILSTAPAAWCSTFYTIHSVPMGAILITTHLYGAYAVIFLMFLHLFRGYYAGSYKKPGRELSWVFGTVLLVLTLGMGFTGYLLPYTQLSYNATAVSVSLVRAVPYVGPQFAQLLVGDGTAQSLLSRMFVAHVIMLPLGIVLLTFAHKRTQLFPRVLLYMTKWGLLYLGLLIGVASLWPWQLPTYTGNLTGVQPVTVPAWYFLWLFKIVDFVGVTPEYAVLFTLGLLLFFLILPFIDRSKRYHPRDRPVFLFLGNSLVGFFILMTVWGGLTPGLQITAGEVALRLGPILAANAAAVAFFSWRHRSARGHPEGVRAIASEPPGVAPAASAELRPPASTSPAPTGSATGGEAAPIPSPSPGVERAALPWAVLSVLFVLTTATGAYAAYGTIVMIGSGVTPSGLWAASLSGAVSVVGVLLLVGVLYRVEHPRRPADRPGTPSLAPGRSAGVLSPQTLLSILGLVGVLFLLIYTLELGPVVGTGIESRFGLGLSFLFLMAGFLVNMAESARPMDPRSRAARFGSTGEMIFPVLALVVVAFLVISLAVAVLG